MCHAHGLSPPALRSNTPFQYLLLLSLPLAPIPKLPPFHPLHCCPLVFCPLIPATLWPRQLSGVCTSRDYRLATTVEAVELAFAFLSWLGGHNHGKRPPSRPFIWLHAWSCQCFTHCASSQAAPFTGGCSTACPSRYFSCVGVCTRPCSGRRRSSPKGGQ